MKNKMTLAEQLYLVLKCSDKRSIDNIISSLWFEHFDCIYKVIEENKEDLVGESLISLDMQFSNSRNYHEFIEADSEVNNKIIYFDASLRDDKRARKLIGETFDPPKTEEEDTSEWGPKVEITAQEIEVGHNPLCGKYPAHATFKWECIARVKGQSRQAVFKTAQEAREWGLKQTFLVLKSEVEKDRKKHEDFWH